MRKVLIAFALFTFHFSFVHAQYALYGMAYGGGTNNDGVIFGYNPFTGKDSIVFDFDGNNGQNPLCSLIQASNGVLYGDTYMGGKYNDGTMFSFDPFSNIYTKLFDFRGINGGPDIGANSLIQAKNDLLYGATFYGGKYNYGIIFSYNIITAKDSVLFNFDSIHGKGPCEGLLLDTISGLLYGMTQFGGTSNNGVLYSFNPLTGNEKVLFNFTDSNGHGPVGGLILSKSGLLYGMGCGGKIAGNGIIFSYDIAKDTEKIVFNFNYNNGSIPHGNSLLQAKNGLLYGMIYEGGAVNRGVMFSFDPVTDSEKVLFNFIGSNGRNPISSLMQDTNSGLIYGMVGWGGTKDEGVIFSYDITTNKQTILVNFDSTNGSFTRSTLLLVKNTPLAVNEIQKNNSKVFIYPNPSNGVFSVELNGNSEKVKVEVYNILGVEIYSKELNTSNTQINLNNNPAGVYLYRIISEKGEYVDSGKLIIQ